MGDNVLYIHAVLDELDKGNANAAETIGLLQVYVEKDCWATNALKTCLAYAIQIESGV